MQEYQEFPEFEEGESEKRSKTYPDLKVDGVHPAMIHFDSFDETASHKSGSTNAGKREGKHRGKSKPYDYRWNYVGNGV